MKNYFLKNNWAIIIVYSTFVLYLITGYGVNNPYIKISEAIYRYSYVLLSLLFIQLSIWKKRNDISFVKSKIFAFCALLIINFYFFCDSYLFSILRSWLSVEKLGIVLSFLAFISGIILLIQLLIGGAFIIKSLLNKKRAHDE